MATLADLKLDVGMRKLPDREMKRVVPPPSGFRGIGFVSAIGEFALALALDTTLASKRSDCVDHRNVSQQPAKWARHNNSFARHSSAILICVHTGCKYYSLALSVGVMRGVEFVGGIIA